MKAFIPKKGSEKLVKKLLKKPHKPQVDFLDQVYSLQEEPTFDKRDKLSSLELSALAFIEYHGPCTTQEILGGTMITKPTLKPILSKLEKLGYIEEDPARGWY